MVWNDEKSEVIGHGTPQSGIFPQTAAPVQKNTEAAAQFQCASAQPRPTTDHLNDLHPRDAVLHRLHLLEHGKPPQDRSGKPRISGAVRSARTDDHPHRRADNRADADPRAHRSADDRADADDRTDRGAAGDSTDSHAGGRALVAGGNAAFPHGYAHVRRGDG